MSFRVITSFCVEPACIACVCCLGQLTNISAQLSTLFSLLLCAPQPAPPALDTRRQQVQRDWWSAPGSDVNPPSSSPGTVVEEGESEAELLRMIDGRIAQLSHILGT